MIHRDQRFRDQPTIFDAPTITPDQVPVGVTSTNAVPYIDHGIVSRDETYVETRPNHSKQAGFVFAAIAAAGLDGITREELSEKLRLPIGSICGRVRELKESLHVIDTEKRRPTSNGKSAAVLVCKEFIANGLGESTPSKLTNSEGVASDFCSESIMPDQITCPCVPVDDHGERIIAGRVYRINNRPVLCYEADGDIFLQHCSAGGQPLATSQPQSIGLLPPNVVIHRVVKS